MYVLNANHISKSYKTAGETMRILQNVNLQVMKGEMVAIMGPSGSGKTTLLHVLTGVDTPDDGEIVIGGETFSQLTEEEKAFLTSLAGLVLVLFWVLPYIYDLFETVKKLFAL